MKTYRIQSTPMIHTPGMFRYIAASGFEPSKQRELLQAMGLPLDVANLLLNGKASWAETENETVTINVHTK